MHDIVLQGEEADLGRFKRQGSAQIYPVILSGGAGTRLWPLSRAAYPKQLLALVSQRTLLQDTAARGLEDAGFAAPIIVCNEEHRFLIDEQLREIAVTPQLILLEPVARNTCPAIAIAAFWLAKSDPEALMLVQPSDHAIGALDAFHQSVRDGIAAAQAGSLVTFGIKPTRGETGYGYIQPGRPLDDAAIVWSVDRFIEKPDRELADRLAQSGAYYWNSGIFLVGAGHFLAELEHLHPALFAACARAVEEGKTDLDFFRVDAAAFAEAPSLSVDLAVMERTDRAAMVPVEMAWSDVGSWRTLRDIGVSDDDGNVITGDAVLEDVRQSYVRSDGRLVVAIGVEDVVIVSTDDAVLVASAERAAEVSGVVETLQQRHRPEPLRHAICHRPWGYYRTVDAGERFQVKRIMVKPGAQLSLQKHFHRAEHWVVVEGTAQVRCGQEEMLVRENESVYIPIGTEHRLANPGKLPLHIIEVQSGAYLGEDDIVRLADNYGRESSEKP